MNMNFKNFGIGNEPPGDGGGRLQGSLPLARQTSIYSLTFDELQNTMGGPGKDFGSMNMDELLKSIWSAEETQTQAVGSSTGVQEGGIPGGYLQRQGSLTLPRTLSQKTVDEVWRGISKDYGNGVKDSGVLGGSNMPQTQRQPTLGEITLEEFLVRAGVVREDTQPVAKPNNDNGPFGNFLQSGNNANFGIGFQQAGQNLGLMGNRIADITNQITFQSANLPLNVNGGRSSPQQLPTLQPQLQPRQQQKQQQQHQQQHQQHQQQQHQQQQHQQQQHQQQHQQHQQQSHQQQPHQQQQQLFPKQPTLPYATAVPIQNSAQLGSPGIRGGIVGVNGITDPPVTTGNMAQSAGLQNGGLGMVALGPGAVTVAMGSPAVSSSDGIGKSNGDTSSVSPIPYIFNGGLRGRKNSAVEKVVERRQRRMIKNRESAARSRARKQAYTMELEAEVAKLKEQNEELRKKQEELIEMQKKQDAMEMMDRQQGSKRRCLRRTLSDPW